LQKGGFKEGEWAEPEKKKDKHRHIEKGKPGEKKRENVKKKKRLTKEKR